MNDGDVVLFMWDTYYEEEVNGTSIDSTVRCNQSRTLASGPATVSGAPSPQSYVQNKMRLI